MSTAVTVGAPIEVTDATFAAQVLQASEPVVVDFWAAWCPPCRAIAPILAELAGEYAGRLTIAKVDMDTEQHYASQLGIYGAPTLVIFHGGKEIERLVGARRKSSYQASFDALLQKVGA